MRSMIAIIVVSWSLLVAGDSDNEKFKNWMKKSNKCIKNPLELRKRYGHVVKVLEKINEQELKFRSGKSRFRMKLNKRSGDSLEELRSWRGLVVCGNDRNKVTGRESQLEFEEGPPSKDYRDLGYMTPVQDQGFCGSCYAFASMCALEGQLFKKYQQSVPLSKQNIVDCSRNSTFGNWGCDGGFAEPTFQYIKDIGGINSEFIYPYINGEQTCQYSADNSVGNATGYQKIYGDENYLKNALAAVGPLVVGVKADLMTFYGYASGVYDDIECNGLVNHAVCLVGYGTDYSYPAPVDYWVIKNSWSTDWGEGGYMRLLRGRDVCNITNYVVYPLV